MKMIFPLALIACILTLTSGSGIPYPPSHYNPSALRYPSPVQQQILTSGLNFHQPSPLHYKVDPGNIFNQQQQGALQRPALTHPHNAPGFPRTNPIYLPAAIAPPTVKQHKQPLTPIAPPSQNFYGQPLTPAVQPQQPFPQKYPLGPSHNPGFLPQGPPGFTGQNLPQVPPVAPPKPQPVSHPKKRPFSFSYTAKPFRKVVEVSPQQGIIPGSIPYSYLVQTPQGPRYATYHRPAALAFKYNAEKVQFKPIEAHGYQVSY